MKKINDYLKNNPIILLIALLLLLIVNTCQNNRINRSVKNINVDNFPKSVVEKMLLEHQKDYLRYEEDIDNKQKSIEDIMSEIDLKILNLNEEKN